MLIMADLKPKAKKNLNKINLHSPCVLETISLIPRRGRAIGAGCVTAFGQCAGAWTDGSLLSSAAPDIVPSAAKERAE